MGRRAVGVTGGLVLALGMGALLLVWLDREEGASGLVFMAGVLAGIVIVAVTALMPGD